MSTINKWIPTAAFESTFLGNAIDNINAQSDVMGKFKTLVNAHTGKVLGINFFSDAPQFGVRVGFSNIANPLTTAGAIMTVAGVLGKKFNVPYTGRLKSLGMRIAIPSAIGAMFEGDAGTGFTTSSITTTQTQQQSSSI